MLAKADITSAAQHMAAEAYAANEYHKHAEDDAQHLFLHTPTYTIVPRCREQNSQQPQQQDSEYLVMIEAARGQNRFKEGWGEA